MPRVRITPNTTYHPGHIGNLMAQVAPGPMALEKDGTVVVRMTDAQLEDFYRRGGVAHKVEVLPDVEPPVVVSTAVVDGNEVKTVIETPSLWQTHAQYVASARGRGMSDQEIVQALVNAGWRESQAIDVVMNDVPPAA